MPEFRILLDECLPVKIKFRFQEYSSEFQVSTVRENQWNGLKNGKLLQLAQSEFDVLVTIDKKMSFQQDLSKYSIAVVALKSHSNRYKDLLVFVEPASKHIQSAKIGEVQYISLHG
jgi:coenzyme F420-reducing hydrogenase alpha subunit